MVCRLMHKTQLQDMMATPAQRKNETCQDGSIEAGPRCGLVRTIKGRSEKEIQVTGIKKQSQEVKLKMPDFKIKQKMLRTWQKPFLRNSKYLFSCYLLWWKHDMGSLWSLCLMVINLRANLCTLDKGAWQHSCWRIGFSSCVDDDWWLPAGADCCLLSRPSGCARRCRCCGRLWINDTASPPAFVL